MKNPLVSVIVTTRNSAKTVENCLRSILKQTYSSVEIIVVDNNSSDKTVEIAKKYTKHIFIKGPERSSQRNYGAGKSRGEYLLFLDSDMSLDKKVIEECVDLMRNNIIGIYIPEKITGNSYWAKVRNYERSFYNTTVIDAIRFMRKTDFQKIKGFDETLFAAEDWDLDKRVRKLGKTAITTSPLFHYEDDFSVAEYIKKKAYYSTNLDVYKNKWQNDSEVAMQFSFTYRYLTVFIEKGKWKKLIGKPDLAFGMLFLRFTVGFTYLFVVLFKPFIRKFNSML